jgi:hypothetical protein
VKSQKTPWERFEASAYLEPTDFVQCYLPLRGKTYRRGVKLNLMARYPEAIHFIGAGGQPDPALFGAKLDERTSKAESDWWKPLIESEEDYESLELPDLREKLFPSLDHGYRASLRRDSKETLERYGAWTVSILGPIDLASQLRGYDRLLADLYRCPSKVHRLFELIARANVEWVNLCCEVLDRVRVLVLADHGLTFLSPKMVETFGLPYWRREYAAAPKGCIKFYHNEGNVTHVLEAVPEMGAQVFHFGWVGFLEAKRRIGEQVCLCGNLNSTVLLRHGSVGEVKEACRDLIQAAAPGGGLIMSSSGGMAPQTPIENVDAIYETAMKYGRYPF